MAETTQDLTFKLQFDSQDIFRDNMAEKGSLEGVDINIKGDAALDGRVSRRGVHAQLQKVILFFASLPGDYLRSERGGPFAFVLNTPAHSSTHFRIITTAMLIMSTRFPMFRVVDTQVISETKSNGSRGWSISLVLQHSSVEGDFSVSIPLSFNSN